MPPTLLQRLRYCIIYIITLLLLTGSDKVVGSPSDEQPFSINKAETERIRRETLSTIRSIQKYHFSQKPFNTLDACEVMTNFMHDLDYNRLFLLQSDEEEICSRFKDTLKPIYLEQGNLYPAFAIFKTYHQRASNRLNWIFGQLAKDFDFSVDEIFIPDRSDLGWPENTEAADKIWYKRLKFDLLQELLRDVPVDEARVKVKRRYERTLKQLEEIEVEDVQEIFLTTIAKMYDPHSTFFSADTLDEFSIAMKNALVGIGAILRDEDGYCVIQELIAGGPAEASGKLHPGDRIVEVTQLKGKPVDVIDMKLQKIVKMIRGTKGTTVHLTILPAAASDVSERRIVSLVRDEVQLTQNLASAKVFQMPISKNGTTETISIGLIELPSFYGKGIGEKAQASTTDDVEELIEKLKTIGIKGLILDLRRNGGGLLSEAVHLTGLFIRQGPVVQVKDTLGNVREDWDRDAKKVYDGPLAVLVSRRSASASEIVAGALQNHNRAIIIGDPNTHGKGTVQQIIPLRPKLNFPIVKNVPKFGAAKITIQKFYLPNGSSTQHEGVRSDIVIASNNAFLPIGESDLPNALEWDAIAPIEWEKIALLPGDTQRWVSDGLIEDLNQKSLTRQQGLEEFIYYKRNLNWFKQKQDEKTVSLNLQKRKEQKEKDTLFKDEMEALRKALTKNNFSYQEVLLNISQTRKEIHQEKLRNAYLPNGKLKPNQYHAKVFYYQPEVDGEIKEIWIEHFDYEKLLKHSNELSALLSEKTNKTLDPKDLEALLTQLKNRDRSTEIHLDQIFQKQYADVLTVEEIDKALPELIVAFIEKDPDIVDGRPPFDIVMREGLRILVDWIEYNNQSVKENTVANRLGSI